MFVRLTSFNLQKWNVVMTEKVEVSYSEGQNYLNRRSQRGLDCPGKNLQNLVMCFETEIDNKCTLLHIPCPRV